MTVAVCVVLGDMITVFNAARKAIAFLESVSLWSLWVSDDKGASIVFENQNAPDVR